MAQQAEAFGAAFMLAEATGFDLAGDIKTVHTAKGSYRCFGILLATGAHPRSVGFKGEEEHKGRGVAYCATCDGEFFAGKEVFVVGGGYAAAEESVFLTKFARHVTVLVRKGDFSCAASVAEQAKNHDKITVLFNTVMEEVSGENRLTYARYKNTATGKVTEYQSSESFGVFVFAGYAPATEAVKGVVALNEQGYIVTDGSQKTNMEGVYAAGDVCIKPLRQVVTATGDGALAATELEKYVAAVHRRTGLRAEAPAPKANKPAVTVDAHENGESGQLFTEDMRRQLDAVFARMERTLLLKLYLDSRPVSAELEQFITALTTISDKLELEVSDRQAQEGFAPCVEVCLADGTPSGLAFHGVPSGHEFTSFVLGLYNAAGPGQAIDPDIQQAIAAISKPTEIKLLVTLSCTMCPDLVVAAQRIAALNPNVTAHVYDIRHFEDLKNRFKVMSVPCMVVNDRDVFFGKKTVRQVLELIG
jgi:thioredoxin reductase (NADPH)